MNRTTYPFSHPVYTNIGKYIERHAKRIDDLTVQSKIKYEKVVKRKRGPYLLSKEKEGLW